MKLSEIQKSDLVKWVEEGQQLSEIQKRLNEIHKLNLTYMEVRFMVDDLNLEIVDRRRKSKEEKKVGGEEESVGSVETELLPEGVEVEVDKLQRPGALVSGSVVFSDGQRAQWQIDQTGRLGIIPSQSGYQPTEEDIREFQNKLESQLQKLGF